MKEDILSNVMTTKEASVIYGLSDSTIRTWVLNGEFQQDEYKKSGNVLILKKEALERVLRVKKMIGKEFVFYGETYFVRHSWYKCDDIEIWLENDEVNNFIENMPFNSYVPQIFVAYVKEKRLKVKNIIFDDNTIDNNNWLYPKEKAWGLTLKAVVDTTRKSLVSMGIDVTCLDIYLNEHNFTL